MDFIGVFMKNRFLCACALVLTVLLIPASAKPKKARSVKVGLEEISTVKKAISVATNYEIPKIYADETQKESFYLAYDKDTKECVFFYVMKDRGFSYRYYNIDGKAESLAQMTFQNEKFHITNSDKAVQFDETKEIDKDDLEGITITLIAQREAIREDMENSEFKLQMLDEINPEQPKVHIEEVNGQLCYVLDK